MLFLMFAAITSLTWGVFGRPYLAVASIMMWGTGDAAAALVGIPFGRHKVSFKPVNGKKSWEGSGAMLIVSCICGFCIMRFGQDSSVIMALTASVIGGISGTLTELLSPSEWDTVTVPSVIAAVLILISVSPV